MNCVAKQVPIYRIKCLLIISVKSYLYINGLALCKIHHAAFDNHFIGINPDYIIKIRTDLLTENDGPMLKYGIQSLNNTKIILPNDKRNSPDKERLEIRFSIFLKAG